jgi:UDP-glucose:glycoprotein glucosyltransferase
MAPRRRDLSSDGAAVRALLLLAAVACVGIMATAAQDSSSANKGVSITLTAEWRSTSALLEAAEFFADEDADAYWSFVEGWKESDEVGCQEQIYEVAARHAGSNETLQVLKLSLGIRKYSPRLEMFRAISTHGAAPAEPAGGEEEDASAAAADPCCWAELGGDGAHVATTRVELDAMIASAARSSPADAAAAASIPHLSELDHVYPAAPLGGDAASPIPSIVFYGAVGTPCFAGFHAALKAAASAGSVKYVHRPVLGPRCERDGCVGLGASGGDRLTVAGFGVEMAVKNMEYKATDDTEVKDTSAGGSGSGGGGGGSAHLSSEDVKGFNFARLAERYPALTPELTSFRDHLVAMDSKDEALKVWDIKDLGLQATQRIALANDPLQMMVDISQNFPSLASSLSRMELDQSVRAEVENNQQRVQPGSIVMSLNGAPMELDTIDIFTLTDRVAAETRAAAKFKNIGLDAPAAGRRQRMQMASREGEGQVLRLNLGGDPDAPDLLSFVNNIETDRAFKTWSPALKQLLRPQGRSQLPPLRRNVYNVVAVLDLGQSCSWTIIDTIQQYIQGRVPLRFAYVLVDNGVGGPDSGKKPRNPMAAMMGMPDDEEDDYGEGSGLTNSKKDSGLPEGVLIGSAMARAGSLLLRRYNARAQGDFLKEVAATRPVVFPGNHFMPAVKGDATWSSAEKAFSKIFTRAFKTAAGETKPEADAIKAAVRAAVADILSPAGKASDDSESARYVAETKAALDRKGASAPAALVNGLYFTRADAHAMGGELEQVIMHYIQLEAQAVAQAVSTGKLTDAIVDATPGGMYGWLHRTAVSKNTPFIVDQVKFPPKYVIMEAPAPKAAAAAAAVAADKEAAVGDPAFEALDLIAYSLGGDAAAFKGSTLWVVADVGTNEGAALVAHAYAFVAEAAASDVRVALLHPPGAPFSPCARAVANAARWTAADRRAKAPVFIAALLSAPFEERDSGASAAAAAAAAGLAGLYTDPVDPPSSSIDALLARQGAFAASKLGLEVGPHTLTSVGVQG